jgi:predicted dehydrogenase
VLCEKPIAISAQEYRDTRALAEQKGLTYIEAIIPRHVEERAVLLQALADIGPLREVSVNYSQRSSRLDAFLAGETPNIFNMSLHAGALMDLGVYCVYGAVDLLGKPRAITAQAQFMRGCDMAGTALFDYEGFTARIAYSKSGEGEAESRFVGQNGTLRVQMISLYDGITLTQNGTTLPLGQPSDRIARMQGEAVAFADLIEKKRNDSYVLHQLTDAVHECMDEIKQKANIRY